MSLQPLLDASLVIQAHAFAAMAAFILGVIQLLAPKGTLPHRTIGLVWIALMLIVAGTSAFIYRPTQPGDPFWARFSLIHLSRSSPRTASFTAAICWRVAAPR